MMYKVFEHHYITRSDGCEVASRMKPPIGDSDYGYYSIYWRYDVMDNYISFSVHQLSITLLLPPLFLDQLLLLHALPVPLLA